jgi:Uma2 family endonuclease
MHAQSQPYPAWGQPLLGGSPFTADDVERLPDDGFRYEVYRGVLIRMPGTGKQHGLICQFIGEALSAYWRLKGERYRVMQNVGFDFTFPGDPSQSTMLVPDVAVSATNAPPDPGIGKVPPLIAVEIASPSETRAELAAKAQFYLGGGVAEVWTVWPKTRTVDVWTTPNAPITHTDQQTLTSAHLPGWQCLISTFFDG